MPVGAAARGGAPVGVWLGWLGWRGSRAALLVVALAVLRLGLMGAQAAAGSVYFCKERGSSRRETAGVIMLFPLLKVK